MKKEGVDNETESKNTNVEDKNYPLLRGFRKNLKYYLQY